MNIDVSLTGVFATLREELAVFKENELEDAKINVVLVWT
jgi:hypothetical protein